MSGSVTVTLTFNSIAEAIAALTSGAAAPAAATSMQIAPGAAAAPTPKSAKTAKPAASVPPAEPQASAAQEQKAPVSEPPAAPAPAAAELPPVQKPISYEESGLAGKIAAAASKDRAAVIALLGEFGVKKGPELDPSQFASFTARINALLDPEQALS